MMCQEEVQCTPEGDKCTFDVQIEEDEIMVFKINNSDNNESIREIQFINSEIYAVPKELFPAFPNLEKLNLAGQKVQEIVSKTFVEAGNLKMLHLDGNNIAELGANVFSGLQKLEQLYLNESHLSILNSSCFDGLFNLQILGLDHNNLDFFPKNIFQNLTKLQNVFLSDNCWESDPKYCLKYIPKNLFEANSNLKAIHLQGNHIQAVVPTMFSHLNWLTFLDLSGEENCVDKTFKSSINFTIIEESLKNCSISEFLLNEYDDIKNEIQQQMMNLKCELEQIIELNDTPNNCEYEQFEGVFIY